MIGLPLTGGLSLWITVSSIMIAKKEAFGIITIDEAKAVLEMFMQLIKRLFPAEQTMKQNQGVYWEKGAFQGCYIIFEDQNSGFSIGSEEIDGPALLINSNSYVYFMVRGANNGCPNDYYVIEDFDGPLVLRHSGYLYESGGQRIRLL